MKVISLVWFFCGYWAASGQTTSLTTEKLSSNLDFPWEIQWSSEGYLWMTQTTGSIIRYDPKYNTSRTLITLPVAIKPDHGNPAAIGLFGLAIHPDFPATPWVYVMYNYDYIAPDSVSTRISRLEYNAATDVLENESIFVENYKGYQKHSGGRMIITQDRKLLITTGDEFIRSYAQRMDKLNGKTLRFNLDGSVPEDNPFATTLSSPFNYIYSYGHRNPQGIIQTNSGSIFSSEHGPNSDDEINMLQAGKNYGWPFVKGFCDDNYPGNWNDNISEGGESELAPYFGTANHQPDLYPYGYENESDYCANFAIAEPAHSFLNERVAPSGLTFYNSDTIPEWKNSLLLATLREKDIRVMKLNEAQDEIVSVETVFNDEFDRVRDLAVTPYGDIYVISSEREDNNINSLYRISKPHNATTASDLNLSFQAADSSFLLQWNASVDYLSYFIIQRTSNGLMEALDTINNDTNTFTDSSINFGQSYTYSIKTIRKGSEIGLSEGVTYRAIDYPVDLTFPETVVLFWDDNAAGIQLSWSAEVDTFTTFIVNRSEVSESINIDTVSSETSSFIDVSVIFGEPYGYVIKVVRDEQMIGKSDSVVFSSLEYPQPDIVTGLRSKQGLRDVFTEKGSSDITSISISLYDLSGRTIQERKTYTWQEWLSVRSDIIEPYTFFLWRAQLMDIHGQSFFMRGKQLKAE